MHRNPSGACECAHCSPCSQGGHFLLSRSGRGCDVVNSHHKAGLVLTLPEAGSVLGVDHVEKPFNPPESLCKEGTHMHGTARMSQRLEWETVCTPLLQARVAQGQKRQGELKGAIREVVPDSQHVRMSHRHDAECFMSPWSWTLFWVIRHQHYPGENGSMVQKIVLNKAPDLCAFGPCRIGILWEL